MERRHLSSDLKKELEDEMRRTGQSNGLKDHGSFVSDGFLAELLTEDNLKAHIKKEYNVWIWLAYPDLHRLVSTIHSDGRKLYSILVLLDRQKDIEKFLYNQPAINDGRLFEKDHTGYRTFCSRDALKEFPQFEDFAEEFYQKQWYFPPMLYSDGSIPTFDLEHFKLPFNKPAVSLGTGGWGAVLGTTMKREYLRWTESIDPVNIAYKRVCLGDYKETKRERVYNEVTVSQARVHPNVTELLGAFISGLEIPHPQSPPEHCLYMIYPWAETDMGKWLRSVRADLVSPDKEVLSRHIYSDAMLGLASGVSWIHCEINGQVGYHRDLKPQNILLFKGKDNKLTWKIADFGCANLKPSQDTGTDSWTSTKYWAPREFFGDGGRPTTQTHGRSHDVYSLGCIFVVLATVIVYGWEKDGLPTFQERRHQQFGTLSDEDQSNSVPGAFHNCEDVVLDWIQELEERKPEDERLKAVLKVIKEMLLPYDERISAWETVVYMFEATQEWKMDLGDFSRKDLDRVKHDEVLKKLKDVIQESRTVDLNMKVTPAIRARRWNRSNDFLLVLKEKQWFESSPQISEELKKRRRVLGPMQSTLPPNTSEEPLFGYQKIFDEVAWGFGSTNVVVLYGLGGIGKTRIALSYASRFAKLDRQDKRHTFWVSMTNDDTIREGYTMIARATGARYGVLKSTDIGLLVSHIENWLKASHSGQWILVVDDFRIQPESTEDSNSHRRLLDLKMLQLYGQILITTRNRSCGTDIFGYNEHKCLLLTPPSLDDRLRIYNHFINTSLFSLVDNDVKELLEHLTLPKLIKEAGHYMSKKNVSPNVLLEKIRQDGFQAVNDFSPDIVGYLLKHHLEEPLHPDGIWPDQIQKLFILAMFGQEGANLELLSVEWEENEFQLLTEALGTLQNSCLIHRSNGPSEVYSIDRTVQAALLAWIAKHEGRNGFLRRFNKILSMIYNYYMKRIGADKSIKFTLQRELLPHFERFIEFVKPDSTPSTNSDSTITFAPRAIQAIIEFSRVLSDQDRYAVAAEVLDFAHRHYPLNELWTLGPVDDESALRLNIRYRLDQQRTKTYLGDPRAESGSSTSASWENARDIVKGQIRKAELWRDTPESRFRILTRRWELSLDLARVYYYLKEWDSAEEELRSMDRINITIEQGRNRVEVPVLIDIEEINSGITGTDNRSVRLRDKRRETLRKLAIRKKWEEGLLHLEKGQYEKAVGKKSEAVSSWVTAKKALRIAEVAQKRWSSDREKHDEILVSIADAETWLGSKEGLKSAHRTFERVLTETEKTYGSDCKRAWDMRCRVNAVRLRTNRDLDIAIPSLESLLVKYKTRFGPQAAATVRCAYQLEEAHVKSNRWRYACGLTILRLWPGRGANAGP
ncbi:hypothetical protein N0V90_002353 [Kalmusia sp. IMI 367209]|nr:hypothetical protein N0V90_002353 [Kalmusia sp. IMI 367209]